MLPILEPRQECSLGPRSSGKSASDGAIMATVPIFKTEFQPWRLLPYAGFEKQQTHEQREKNRQTSRHPYNA